ncbi:hypothetical protein LTR56_002078 [Elasticomyces elasticus]|nr:hypothetical protein LTR22_012220 [Elasticomyces elasticus]KAK3658221.1 hypothetical protein LTR56_002078 [Elasticomyces elasticus]KAK4919500.1 hypothetical protein LTR49_012878 [Elasticomyces elasticus]KAK5764106.1 hypothetical protein LTS12_005800 [Elasticomyces elasticus]
MFKHVPSPLQTPPSSLRKKTAPTYYEDIYGMENSDEDQHPDQCESESDSDDDMAKREPTNRRTDRIFEPFMRTSKQHVSDNETEHSGETSSDETALASEEGALAEGDIFSNQNLPYNNNNTNTSKQISTSRPNLFETRRTSTKATPKNITPTKNFGMFGVAPLTPETSNMDRITTSDAIAFSGFGERDIISQASTTSINQHPNNAMATDDVNDTFATLEPADDLLGGLEDTLMHSAQEDQVSQNLFDFGLEQAAALQQNGDREQAATGVQPTFDFGLDQPIIAQQDGDNTVITQVATELDSTAPVAQMDTTDPSRAQSARDSPMPGSFPEEAEAVAEQNDMEEDGGYQADVDNTIDQIEAPQPKRRGRPPKSATPSKESAPATTTDDTPRSTRSTTTKQIEAEKAEKIANRLRKRQSLPAPTRASPRNKETARSATLRKKGKQAAPITNGVNKKTVAKGSRKSGRLEGVRNWKGEKLDVGGKGYVKVQEEVEDRAEYEKHY